LNDFGKLKQALFLLSLRDRRRLIQIMIAQALLSFLDLIGVGLIGAVGALTINGVQSKRPSGLLADLTDFAGISDFSLQSQVAILGFVSVVALLSKTALSIFFTRKILHFLSSRGAVLSTKLIKLLFSQPITSINQRSSQDTLFTLTQGVMSVTLGVLGSLASLISDLALLIIISVALFIVEPLVSLGTIAMYSVIALALHKALHKQALSLGINQTNLHIKSNQRIVEIVKGFRELLVRDRVDYYVSEIANLRFALSTHMAQSAFLPFIGKYVIETSVLIGGLAIGAIQFILTDAASAVSTLSIFLAAGLRIAPAVLRLQQGALNLKSHLGSADKTLQLVSELNSLPHNSILSDDRAARPVEFHYSNFEGKIEFKGVNYSYPTSGKLAVEEITFSVGEGEFVAIVGESGSGKSTIADLMLGVLSPNVGSVEIAGMDPLLAIRKWPGAIAYVPQDPLLIEGSIAANITLGYPEDSMSQVDLNRALNLSQLEGIIQNLDFGVDTHVGESGWGLSGGQKQRLGIARALYPNPKVIVLDEATSALDANTESEISSAINSLKGKVTIVMIAHRLSTVRKADKVIYLENGKIVDIGLFEDLRSRVPKFDQQARLMGL